MCSAPPQIRNCSQRPLASLQRPQGGDTAHVGKHWFRDMLRSESIRVLGTDRRSVMMIRVKVNSKSELVENTEGKSALYGVICCCDDRLLSRAVVCGHAV